MEKVAHMFGSLSPTKKQIVKTIIGGVIVIAFIALLKFMQIKWMMWQGGYGGQPPEAVTSIIAAETVWPRQFEATGSLMASRGVTIKSEEPGKVTKIFFDSGQQVAEGSPLIEIDTSVEEADLAGAEASLDRARKAFNRAQGLINQKAVSQSDFETAQSSMRESQAQVEMLKAKIARKHIVAPFTGHSGIRMVNVGQYLNTGDNVVPLYTLDPLYVNFNLAQRAISGIRIGVDVVVHSDVYEGQEFRGKLTAINPQINESTRTVELQGTIPNPDGRLRPGMFGHVTVVLPETDKFITIPASSVYHLPYADTVYVIEDIKKPDSEEMFKGVRQQVVKVGLHRGDQAAILEGLKVGEEVVTSGAFKLRPGLAVTIHNELAPGNDPNPQVQDR